MVRLPGEVTSVATHLLVCGTVFKLDRTGEKTVLHSFTGGADGARPFAGLIRDTAGNLYGTTGEGGTFNFGTVFKVDATGAETVLHSFNWVDGLGTRRRRDPGRDRVISMVRRSMVGVPQWNRL